MASLEFDKASGRYRVRFRHAGRAFKRSLKTGDRREGKAVLARVEETIRFLERGRLDLPSDSEPGLFILSDGKLNGKTVAPKAHSLSGLVRLYLQSLPEGAKAHSTLKTEETHLSHLLRHLRGSQLAQAVGIGDMQTYVKKRLRDKYRGKSIHPDTVKKEVATLRLIWNWGVSRGHLEGPAPTNGIAYPKSEQKSPFMTWDEIQRVINRGGLSAEQEAGLWESLYLTLPQIEEVLDHVRKASQYTFVLPMFVLVAHTGARRSEILKSQMDDFDFESRTVLIREKKRNHEKSLTYRRVRMSDSLMSTMSDWFSHHPGGPYAICAPPELLRRKARERGLPLTRSEAHDHFKRALRGSKWSKIRGFHVFRHSFASNLAAAGVDQRIIDEWMGHQTEEMRKRYRHVFPDQQQKVIDSVFGGNGK